MSQQSNKSESSDWRPRKRGRPPSIHSNASTPGRHLMKRRREALVAKSKTKSLKPLIPISQCIVSPDQESPTSSQQSSGNPYNDAICLVCWMPFCIRHSVPAPRRHASTSTKWTLKREDIRDSNIAKSRKSFVPCSHEGPCDPNNSECSCSDESVYCEKFCGCGPDCPRRWKGCTCRSGKPCTGERCPCVRENRECDPDLCSSCGADEQLDPVHRGPQDTEFRTTLGIARSTTKADIRLTACQNVPLQLNEPPMTKVGPTSMPFEGDGLFAMESIKKGGFVGEYTGEVISGEEADRRVDSYDSSVSFLFEINSTHEIDGTQYGNKTRFLNHSKLEPNCEPKVLLVNGIHRIAFRALEDIEPGQELLFNYGETFFQFEAVEREGAAERGAIKKRLQRLKDTRTESDLECEDEAPSPGPDEQRLVITTKRQMKSRAVDKLKTKQRARFRIPDSEDDFSNSGWTDDDSEDDPVAAQIQRERAT
ncbi:hypothetical protein TWF481_001341 [Arthrobotrys musiformis]|uniref:SET domain-containing protein n=1 Tax=Arthrobotrys musiformis TaxID=47236 RepID=A0AAV9WRQ2_9PEZI